MKVYVTRIVQILMVINTNNANQNENHRQKEIFQSGIQIQNKVIDDINITWETIATKLTELEYLDQTGWKTTNHPFAQMRYKVFNATMTFKVAARNCKTHQSFLLYGDPDTINIIDDLTTETKVWISTQDTQAMRIMEEDEIQEFLDGITKCHTIRKTDNSMINPARTECEEPQQSICIRLLKHYRETKMYKQELTKIKNLHESINTEDKPLVIAIGRILRIGSPLEDNHHPAQLQQTMNLLSSTLTTVTALSENIPILPTLSDITFRLQTTRNTEHSTLLLILTQHLINYATRVEALTESYRQLKTEPERIETRVEEETSSIVWDEDPYQATLKVQEIELTVNRIQEDMKTMKDNVNHMTTQINRVNQILPEVNQNKARIKAFKAQIKGISRRLSTWISNETIKTLTEDNQGIPEMIEKAENETISEIAKFAIDFLEDETNIWVAAAITLVLTIIALANSICMCVYIRKTSRRNRLMKEHLQLTPKYRNDNDVERPLMGTRIEKMEKRVLDLEKKLIAVQQEVKEKCNAPNQPRKKKKASAPSAPQLGPRKN